jgi:hypothetical protein
MFYGIPFSDAEKLFGCAALFVLVWGSMPAWRKYLSPRKWVRSGVIVLFFVSEAWVMVYEAALSRTSAHNNLLGRKLFSDVVIWQNVLLVAIFFPMLIIFRSKPKTTDKNRNSPS